MVICICHAKAETSNQLRGAGHLSPGCSLWCIGTAWGAWARGARASDWALLAWSCAEAAECLQDIKLLGPALLDEQGSDTLQWGRGGDSSFESVQFDHIYKYLCVENSHGHSSPGPLYWEFSLTADMKEKRSDHADSKLQEAVMGNSLQQEVHLTAICAVAPPSAERYTLNYDPLKLSSNMVDQGSIGGYKLIAISLAQEGTQPCIEESLSMRLWGEWAKHKLKSMWACQKLSQMSVQDCIRNTWDRMQPLL